MPTVIRSVRTNSGFLKNAPVEFADGLTCVIGGRGTCKSTLVETIRFAFNCDPDRVAALLATDLKGASGDSSPSSGLIPHTLQQGRVCCELVQAGAHGTDRLTVEREVGSAPQIYREGVRELADDSILQRVEIYSQGDLQLIAQEDKLRLDLIDRPHKARIDALKAERERHTHALRDIGPKIRAKRIETEAKRAELQALDGLRAQLSEIQRSRPTLSEELDRERSAYLDRQGLLQDLDGTLKTRGEVLGSLLSLLPTLDALPKLVARLEALGLEEARRLGKILIEYAQFVAASRVSVGEAMSQKVDEPVAAIRKRLEELNARYYALRQDQQALNDSLKREDTLKQQIIHLERVQADLERLEAEVADLSKRRQESRDSIRRVGDDIFALRVHEVEAINSRHSEVIILTLEQGVRSPGYVEKLTALLRGSNLRNQVEVVRDLAEKVRPADLVDMVERSDANRLATALGRDLGQMTRLIGFVADSPGLYELEGVTFEDRLEITMYDDGMLKPVNQLSKGQMATALLPLILRSAEYPLIFDQPEDDLDNRFIFRTLVEIVRTLKRERQLIFVTHNANIPVLGEADRVIVMDMATPLAAAPPTVGPVDEVKEHILNLLEGGKEAFRLRQQKYQALLAS